MSNRFEEIARHKQILVDQCAREREELAATCHRIQVPLSVGALLMLLGKTLKSYPVLVAGISSLLVSGYGGKLARSTGKLLGLGRAILPFWSWWAKRRKRK